MNSEFYLFFPSTAFSCNGKVMIKNLNHLYKMGWNVIVYYILFACIEPVLVNR